MIGLIYLLLKNKYLYRGFHFLTMQCRNRMQLDESHELDLHFNDYYRHRMAEWQAYMALPQIENLDKLILRRKEIYRRYDSSIRETPVLRKPVSTTKRAASDMPSRSKTKHRSTDVV